MSKYATGDFIKISNNTSGMNTFIYEILGFDGTSYQVINLFNHEIHHILKDIAEQYYFKYEREEKEILNDKGGKHYRRKKIQSWDFSIEHGLDALSFNIIKYVWRYKYKNGLEDIEKAIHYTEKYLIMYDEVITTMFKENSYKDVTKEELDGLDKKQILITKLIVNNDKKSMYNALQSILLVLELIKEDINNES